MFHEQPLSSAPQRRGVILMVVLALLTLFAVVGLSFVYYANAQATASQIGREAEVPPRADIEAELLASFFLGQLIFDCKDDESGIYSALRGHSLARSMYGAYYPRPGFPDPEILNNLPFNGIGRLHTSPGAPEPLRPMNPFGVDDWRLINYTYYPNDFQLNPNDSSPPTNPSRWVSFLRDPERTNIRSYLATPQPGALPPWRLNALDKLGPFVGGFNAPYTYPDLNNMLLGAVKAGPILDSMGRVIAPPGAVLLPSFHRPWLFGLLDDIPDQPAGHAGNTNWTFSVGRYQTLRPRPVDQLTAMQIRQHDSQVPPPLRLEWLPLRPGLLQPPETMTQKQKEELAKLIASLQAKGQLFPYPEDTTGDVKNLIGGPGAQNMFLNRVDGNDSLWIDLGFPVKTGPDGRKYKPLFAALIVDLDNRINLNVHGNLAGGEPGNRDFVDNQSWGPWSVDVKRVLNSPSGSRANAKEWQQLFVGSTVDPTTEARSGPYQVGRYGFNMHPIGIDRSYKTKPHNYAKVDYDGRVNATGNPPTPRLDLKAAATRTNCFPLTDKNVTGYENYVGEVANHPSVYNVFDPGDHHRFPLSNLEALLRFGDTGSPSFTSELLRVCPSNFIADPLDSLTPPPGNPITSTEIRRRVVTLRSFDVERPGVTPWIPNYFGNRYKLSGTDLMPSTPQLPFTLPDPNDPAQPPGYKDVGDFRKVKIQDTPLRFATDWRAISAALGRLDLNRPLPPYPPAKLSTGITDEAGFRAAEVARQQFARDIYFTLITVTGAYNPFTPFTPQTQPNDSDRDALRALAQLAVNIVDFIDEDDYSTPFNWGDIGSGMPGPIPPPSGFRGLYHDEWVFGVELPRVVINEAYAQYVQAQDQPRPQPQAEVEVWVELYNPMSMEDPALHPGLENGDVHLEKGYRLLLCAPVGQGLVNQLRNVANPLGFPGKMRTVNDPSYIFTQDGSNRNQAAPGTQCVVNFATGAPPGGLVLKTSEGRDGRPIAGNGDKGYFVVGPQLDASIMEENPLPAPLPPYLARAEMKYKQSRTEVPVNKAPWAPTVVLQRLACPYRPYNPLPGSIPLPGETGHNPALLVNPYVTIDFFLDVNKGSTDAGNPLIRSQNHKFSNDPKHVARGGHSEGRDDPFAGFVDLNPPNGQPQVHKKLQQVMPPPSNMPQHTFYTLNFDAPSMASGNHFHWLTHLDRPLISPMELMYVPFVKSALLTSEFLNPNRPPNVYAQRAAWFDEDHPTGSGNPSHLLYRLLEFVATRSRAAGLEAPTTPGQYVDSGTIEVPRLSWLTPSGVPIGFREGDVVIIDKGQPTHENVRIQGIGEPQPGRFVLKLTAPGILKRHDAPAILIELTLMDSRVPGKININTLWDREPFYAMAAATISHNYDRDPMNPGNPPDVKFDTKKVYDWFVQALRPGTTSGSPDDIRFSATDHPLLGMAAPHYQPGTQTAGYGNHGVNHTLLRSHEPDGDGATSRIFQVPFDTRDHHPFVANQLLNRIFNTVTTRSNVFAVWLTVGFFEVTDDSVRPVKLGAEIGRSENRQIRHRSFSIVDRTALTLPSRLGPMMEQIQPGPLSQPFHLWDPVSGQVLSVTQPVSLGEPPPIGPLSRPPVQVAYWTLQPGDRVIVGGGTPNQETVIVTEVNVQTNEIKAVFAKRHDQNETVSIHVFPGNPGPILRFNPRDPLYEEVVPYLSIID